MAWHIVEKLLEQTAEHSTLVGKFWVTFFFVLRFLMVVSIADTVFGDEQGKFVCNTLTPGCENVCFNDFSPVSLIRLWALQVGFTSFIFVNYISFAWFLLYSFFFKIVFFTFTPQMQRRCFHFTSS